MTTIVVQGGAVRVVTTGTPAPAQVIRTGTVSASTPDSTTSQRVTNVALGGHRVVRQTATGPDYADCGVLLHQENILGLTTGAAAAGALVTIQRDGEIIEPSWNWLAGLVFLGHNGLLTQTLPSSPDSAFIQAIGFSTAPQTLYVALRDPITMKD